MALIVGAWALSHRDRQHFDASGRCSAQRISCSARLALCIGTTVLIKMRKSHYLWITALPMLFVGTITLTGSYEMFWTVLWPRPRRSQMAEQAFALYLDAVLVAVVALLGGDCLER